jgi:multiple sugar transport system substrate-binding protein
MASADGFPTDEASNAALVPVYVGIEMPASEHSSEISTILNEEHTLIMTHENTIEEGIEAMNERVAELLG